MQFRLFGGVAAWVDDQLVDVGHARRQCVLVALLVEANRPVSAEQLIERVWGDCPPNSARNALHGYLARLRTAGLEINRNPGGYVLVADERSVDLHRFRQLLAQARSADDERALVLYGQALELWCGEPFAGLDTAWLTTVRTALDAERAEAELDYTDVRLRCGQHADLVLPLAARADQRPLDERLAGQLMLALYRSGRQAEALTRYELTRGCLAEELGTDPGPALRKLHQQILREDPALALSAPRSDLPGDVADFTGRADEIRQLLDVSSGTTVVISAIDGMAGIGKTTLALRAAHQLADRYPDGQLFLDLHGYTEGRQPVAPAAALSSLLCAVGVPVEQIPDSVEERASRWRAELAQRQVLVVLDNAATAAQVRPLLPGTAGSLTLVTSRRRLSDLDTARSISLELLPRADAIALFTRIIGWQRADAEPDAIDEVAQLCGYLPLALRIAAARLRSRTAWSVAHLAERLRDERRRLTELAVGDRSVAAAFSLSYHDLPPERQRLLGLVPGPHWDAYLAGALTGTHFTEAEEGLEQLLDVHLLTQPAPGRYQLHDLLREHARTVALAEEPETERDAAVDRVLGYYCTAGTSAAQMGVPIEGVTDRPFRTDEITTGLPEFTSYERGTSWLKTERPNLYAAQKLVPDGPGAEPVRLQMLMLLAFAQCLDGQGAEGVESSRRLLALIPGEDGVRRMIAAMLCATVERMFGSPGRAKSLLLGELNRLPDNGSAESAALHLRLAVEHLTTGDAAGSGLLLDQLEAMELDPAMRFALAVLRAMSAYLCGDIPAAREWLDIADARLPELAPHEHALWIEALSWLCWTEVLAGRVERGLARLDYTAELARTNMQNYVIEHHVIATVYSEKAFTLGRLGRLAEAAALAAEAVDRARLVGLPETMSMALSAHSLVLSWLGDHDSALRLGAEAARCSEGRRDWRAIMARCGPGLVLVYSGDVDAGRESVRNACDDYESFARDETEMLVLLEALAYAEAARGRPEDATEWVERAERVRHPAHETNVAVAELIRAHALTASEPDRSAELALKAAETFRTNGFRLEEGRARLRAGVSLSNAGHHDRALTELTASAKLFTACGARALRDHAITARGELPQRVRRLR
ncbi:NB-ARC domain-containing protein [Allokutzneria sp. A3M-2-11 16]|uniref:AfsR/SARP family transcriptional regulator n=1 Tax=Allokutzneria sp. A3M-2-11 16 TaxID=2962043 RepID=UPI0020B6FAB5|nr:AfsR/SARP family transcriptional regulator [Allokutzneria sp. A3M-2-11 16]MCP3800651.1 NB-ARC domain-containing protein [Allokutzneria sp. A3M-2-11 16]